MARYVYREDKRPLTIEKKELLLNLLMNNMMKKLDN